MSGELASVLVKGAPLPTSAADARDHVEALLRERFVPGDDGFRDDTVGTDALLVTSELVTNASHHGGGLTDFSARIQDDELFLSVADGSTELPVVRSRTPGEYAVGGYGWPMVIRLTKRLSVVPTAGGKTIEAVISLT
ncbi:ATP-binding protein [Streptomyces sp. NBC_00247]|uniref:ATP-binding protein n=1 Tax=Streptomyces sp. NBC_00247 TaxID=2975689 RepID=UPI002E29F3CC|nr:ATP-binding protein [Streptomyces sp. NBC_00247]